MPAVTTAKPFQPRIERRTDPVSEADRDAILNAPGFGQHFTDHMFLAEWTPEAGWHDERIVPYGPLALDPATAALHYAQEIFEGLKAYRHENGSVWVFRPEQNAARFQRSAARMMLPELPIDWFIESIDALLSVDGAWVPGGGEKALYLRPFMFGSESFLGVRSARKATYAVIASPVGGYFDAGVKPVSLWLAENYTRASAGGTGAAKCGGNYAASLLPLAEAAQHGCEQVVFLDATEHRMVEELGGMNLYFVYDDGQLVTPASDSILDGIIKKSLRDVAADLGYNVTERPIAIEEWTEGVAAGRITEVFACGTAAVITPIGRLVWSGGEVNSAADGQAGPVTATLRRALVDLQYGRAQDTRGWMHRTGR
ncbi:branched-chain amino acid aminotransferase [Acrocarpospora macrocephala]|uniref:Branched-chain-amino-acid aminotransferase n=1 Tax=Acrocarpospora macrocephala TaxID=150177 RepID=A0A5M3WUM1_9ACTN|nr:branched-chain amino acid aminotransferase [Acrocarpospora macrocephala]GES12584.1 branched-chain-amino-acid aminotransferase [Acrocarpospora macrocephala]